MGEELQARSDILPHGFGRAGPSAGAAVGLPRCGGRTFLYLAGNSFPKDQHVEAVLRDRIVRPEDRFIGQMEILARYNGGMWDGEVLPRRAMLQRALDDLDLPPERVVLVGRSSGARVVTQVAAYPQGPCRPGAVICVAYPFRHPQQGVERDRFLHLSVLGIPTMILQGWRDPYGGIDVPERYLLSAMVEMVFVNETHDMRLPRAGWAGALKTMSRFLDASLAARELSA